MTDTYLQLVDSLVDCGKRVREAVVRAEYHRLAEVVGLGADGADTTHIDQLAEESALACIEAIEPRMNILSEEIGFLDRGSALTAIVDPIDATNNAVAVPNFVPQPGASLANLAETPLREGHVFGFPYYAFSVGVIEDGRLVAGCVMNLPTGEVFTAARGHGVRLDGVPVRARPVTTLAEARVALIRPETDAAWRTLRRISVEARRIRVTGCSALDLALIACGTLEALINPNRISPRGFGEKIVDYAGALALLNETGSVLSGFDGVPVPVDFDLTRRTPLVAAATPELHAELIEALHAESWDDVTRDANQS
ncbi:MAG TPA: inositol monophosphatase family protein [Thermomicrobiales bacterium]|nr:inositol monophosphatase family protein [Thermomicrobiales bacterium]